MSGWNQAPLPRDQILLFRSGADVSPNTLPMELSELKKRQAKLSKALAAANKADARRAKRKSTSKRAVKVPVADPDSAIMPNKEGGDAPDFNPIAAADGACRMIVDADVLNEMKEAETVIPTVERIESTFGRQPEQFLADSTFGTGSILSGLADRGIEAVMPVEQTKLPDENPAERADPTRPVAEADWAKLPRRAQTKKLDRAAFVYDEKKDCYHCPLGRELAFDYMKMQARDTGEASAYRVYTCGSCEGCGLASDCLKG